MIYIAHQKGVSPMPQKIHCRVGDILREIDTNQIWLVTNISQHNWITLASDPLYYAETTIVKGWDLVENYVLEGNTFDLYRPVGGDTH